MRLLTSADFLPTFLCFLMCARVRVHIGFYLFALTGNNTNPKQHIA